MRRASILSTRQTKQTTDPRCALSTGSRSHGIFSQSVAGTVSDARLIHPSLERLSARLGRDIYIIRQEHAVARRVAFGPCRDHVMLRVAIFFAELRRRHIYREASTCYLTIMKC